MAEPIHMPAGTQRALLARMRATGLPGEQSEAVERAAAALAQVPEYEAKLARVFAQMNALPARTARMRERFS